MRLGGILFPKKCIYCETIHQNIQCGLCEKCFQRIRPSLRLKGSLNYLLIYDKKIKKILNQAKYGHRTANIKLIAEYFGKELNSQRLPIGVITYVPMYFKDEGKRGFNQSKIIAEEIAKQTQMPLVHLLVKKQHTSRQASLTREARYNNLEGVFALSKQNKTEIKGKIIYIVDDICTTGSTLRACKQALLATYPQAVRFLTLAYVDENKGYTHHPQFVDNKVLWKKRTKKK